MDKHAALHSTMMYQYKKNKFTSQNFTFLHFNDASKYY